MKYAKYKRVLQFKSGPNEFQFHSCEEHKPYLTVARHVDPLFFIDPKNELIEVSEDDEIECDFCREP